MDIFGIIFLSCVSVLFGMILMIFLQYCVLLKYFKQSPKADIPRKPFTEAFCLPEVIFCLFFVFVCNFFEVKKNIVFF